MTGFATIVEDKAFCKTVRDQIDIIDGWIARAQTDKAKLLTELEIRTILAAMSSFGTHIVNLEKILRADKKRSGAWK
jgi:hypothetical protein